jgi:hypothetical protein
MEHRHSLLRTSRGSPIPCARLNNKPTTAFVSSDGQTNRHGCVSTVERGKTDDRLRLFSPRSLRDSCWSYLGRRKSSDAQDLSLGLPGCTSQATIIHELLHAVGFAHEQKRPDRDQFVTINWANIKSDAVNNFEIHSTSDVNTFNRPYDLGESLIRTTPKQAHLVSFIQLRSCTTERIRFRRMVNRPSCLVKRVSIPKPWAVLRK